MPLNWKNRVKQAVSSGGTGTLTLGAAASGYQAFAAGDDALLFPYVIEDGTAWETGWGTYTHSGTTFARTNRTESSTGSALNVSTSAYVYVDVIATTASGFDIAAQGIVPGGRLTLESGVPVSTSDQTAKTTVYYTPYVHNSIVLWDGNRWTPVNFSEVSVAIGTVTADLGFDVFGYLSSGALVLEKLAWTSATARATAITLQDGRYCKSGDKTRLWLGSFYSKSTTTTEDSLNYRLVFNAYNRVLKSGYATESSSFTYSTSAYRVWNAATYASKPDIFSNWFIGIAEHSLIINASLMTDGGVGHYVSPGREDTRGTMYQRKFSTSSYVQVAAMETMPSRLGLNSCIGWQWGGGDGNSWRSSEVSVGGVI